MRIPALRHAESIPIGPSTATALLLWSLAGCATAVAPVAPPIDAERPARQPGNPGDLPGVLVMAHGGGAEWNRHVEAAVSDLGERLPLAIAFGMANPHTLQAALDSLDERGVRTVAVVRLFISPESFLHQTEYLFGLRGDPPARGMIGHRMVAGDEFEPLAAGPRILLDRQGLMGSEQAARIMVERALANAPNPSATGALLIAHGMGAEEENERVLASMEPAAAALREAGIAEVEVATLREDWRGPRDRAERGIRAAVDRMGRRWSRVVVIPYRLFGFGPYAGVLEGLDYVGAEGLLPHPLVSDWVAARATATFCAAGIASPLGPCYAAHPQRSR